MKFFEAFANIFRIPDLRKRVLFTLALLAVYRLGAFIPTPGIDVHRLEEFFQQNQGTLFWLHRSVQRWHVPAPDDLRAGHHAVHYGVDHSAVAHGRGSNARETAEGRRTGRRKITQWTRYLTVGLAMMQSFGIAMRLQASEGGFVPASRNWASF